MGPTWDPSGADRTKVGPMMAPWTLLFGVKIVQYVLEWFRFDLISTPLQINGKLMKLLYGLENMPRQTSHAKNVMLRPFWPRVSILVASKVMTTCGASSDDKADFKTTLGFQYMLSIIPLLHRHTRELMILSFCDSYVHWRVCYCSIPIYIYIYKLDEIWYDVMQ